MKSYLLLLFKKEKSCKIQKQLMDMKHMSRKQPKQERKYLALKNETNMKTLCFG